MEKEIKSCPCYSDVVLVKKCHWICGKCMRDLSHEVTMMNEDTYNKLKIRLGANYQSPISPTIEELREAERTRSNAVEVEKVRLQEKVLCAEITFPNSMKKALGINGFTMKAEEVQSFVEQEMENGDKKSHVFVVKYFYRTNKWIENLPEADI